MLTSGAAVVGFGEGFVFPSREGLLVDAPNELDLLRACSSLCSCWFSWRSASSCRQIAGRQNPQPLMETRHLYLTLNPEP